MAAEFDGLREARPGTAPVAPTTSPTPRFKPLPQLKPLPVAPENGDAGQAHEQGHSHGPEHGLGNDPEVCGDGLVISNAGLAGGRLSVARALGAAAMAKAKNKHAAGSLDTNALTLALAAGASPSPASNNGPLRIHMVVYGCQMNKADGELIGGMLAQRGYQFTPTPEDADVILFETCSVRKQSEDRVFSALGGLKPWKKRNPAAVIGVLGCMAQKEGRTILDRNPHVDLVVGTSRLQDVPDLIEEIRNGAPPTLAIETGLGREADFASVMPRRENSFQAWLPVTRGCNKKCTYCVVPYTRGPEVSLPMDRIVEQVQRLADDGVREITLLGQTIDTYGEDLNDPHQNLANLLVKLDAIEGLWRIRFITSYPAKLSEDVFRAIADTKKVCEYAHMPVQSASDRMLKRMKRGYKIAAYREMVEAARKHVPSVGLASDVIVGFCGESEEDYIQTRTLMEEIRFHTCYVFKYSPREGTPAMKLPDDVPQEIKEQRNSELLVIQRKIAKERQAEMEGTVQEVLVEGPDPRRPELWMGRTRSNRTVAFGVPANDKASAQALTGCLTSVKIHRSATHLLTAELEAVLKR